MFSSRTQPAVRRHGALLGRVFGLLAFAALLTAGGALVAPQFGARALSVGSIGGLVVIVVLWIGRRLPSLLRLGLFYLFSVFQGLVLGIVLEGYVEGGSADIVVLAAAVTAGLVLVVSAYAWTTKRNVGGIGGYLFVGLIGVLIAAIGGIFVTAPLFHVVLAAATAILFSGYLVYHVHHLKYAPARGNAIELAITLYIDVLNLFWSILRLLNYWSVNGGELERSGR